jgi:hypothetical protein
MTTFIIVLCAVFATWYITREENYRDHFKELAWRDDTIKELRSEIVTLKAQIKN